MAQSYVGSSLFIFFDDLRRPDLRLVGILSDGS